MRSAFLGKTLHDLNKSLVTRKTLDVKETLATQAVPTVSRQLKSREAGIGQKQC